jgi:hypothetical protein
MYLLCLPAVLRYYACGIILASRPFPYDVSAAIIIIIIIIIKKEEIG